LLTAHSLVTIQEIKGWYSLKQAHRLLVTLSRHLQCVTHVDHYCKHLLQQLEDGTIISLTLDNSNTFVSLCVKKQHSDITLNLSHPITSEEREKAVIFSYPTYYRENHIQKYELFFQKEVDVLHDDKGISRIVLIWIQRSFFYRYKQSTFNRLSILHKTEKLSMKIILHYWLYFLYTRMKRRQC